jgi:lipopolysaccharide cholinephosphotransferase
MSDLEKLQDVLYELLKQFVTICDTHGLQYFCSYGTVLGVVRHGGFIPWDDDIDLALPREDYDILISILTNQKVLGENSGFALPCSEAPFKSEILRIFNKNVTKTLANGMNYYAYLDIVPIDGTSENKITRSVSILINRVLLKLYYISMRSIDLKRKDKRFFRDACLLLLRIPVFKLVFRSVFNNKKLHELLERRFKRTPYSDSSYVIYNYSNYGSFSKKVTFPRNWLGKGTKRKFRDIEVSIPANYEKYLTHFYGDYMTLPPEDQRNQHGIVNLRIIE